MFAFKHQIQLKTSEKIWLFGEDYYNDKNIFSNAHRATLVQLCKKINVSGFPITIKDLQANETLKIYSKSTFSQWLITNQQFQCKDGL